MVLSIWQYEYPIWISHFKNKNLFGKLPNEIIKLIIANIIDNIKERIKKQLLIENMLDIKTRIHIMFDKNSENFHFENDIVCDMEIVKSILMHTAKIKNKPIRLCHICCSGKGIVFEYINNKDMNVNIRKKIKNKLKLLKY
jgi:hypothetical protein